ncbi:MAG: NAD(P)H-binding protein [Candidatus Saccharibacteria bacterium]
MKIAVIAANGRTGRAFVAAALRAGHQVRAGIHTHRSLVATPGLTFIECDATQEAEVTKLILGQDAVVSFIGHSRRSPADVQTNAMKVIVSAMDKLNQKRIISLTGTGVRFPNDKITLTDRILNMSIDIIDPKRVVDGINHVEVLKNSELDWTIIRVLKLTAGRKRQFSLHANGPTKPFVSRQEVAQAVLELLEQHSFIRNAPIIGRVLATS